MIYNKKKKYARIVRNFVIYITKVISIFIYQLLNYK